MHASTPLGFALAKEIFDVLDGMRVGVRVIGGLMHASTRSGLSVAKESNDVLLRLIDLLLHRCYFRTTKCI